MTDESFMHIAFMVADLDEGIAEFGEKLGVGFTESTWVHVDDFRVPVESRPLDVRAAYSTGGPPYYELFEAQDDGFFARQNGLGFHHVGVWESDCESRMEALVASGMEVEAVQYTPDGRIIVAYLNLPGVEGMRLEVVDEARRPMMEAWIAGEEFVDYV